MVNLIDLSEDNYSTYKQNISYWNKATEKSFNICNHFTCYKQIILFILGFIVTKQDNGQIYCT